MISQILLAKLLRSLTLIVKLFAYFVLVPNNRKSASELFHKVEHFFLNLNLFPSVPPTTNKYQLRNQRISTRLFIFLLTILLSTLLLYISLINITEIVNVKAPSIREYEQLYNSYNQTLTCDCTQISINYEKFIEIQYTLHQVCYSDFVTQEWFDYLVAWPGNDGPFYDTFRVMGVFVFQALSTLCILVDRTILNRLTQFNSTQYVSASVAPSNVFQLQTDAFVSQFLSSTTNEFLLSLAMIRKTTQGNALASGQFTNYRFYYDSDSDLFTISAQYSDCTCSSSATCIDQFEVLYYPNYTKIFPIPGLYTGCYIIEALLQSDLQCFYDQVCIDNLLLYLGLSTLMNVTALDTSMSSQFLENSTIGDILDQLMVEEWINSSMYENYYNESILVQEPNVRTLYKLKHHFATFNIFASVPPTTHEHQLRNQRISTRLFIFLLTILLFILLLYTSLINITQTINVKTPSIIEYEQLYNSYNQTLTCECTQVSINYEKFIQIQYTLHQICHSDFVTQNWTDYLATSSGNSELNSTDFRLTSTFTFQTMSTFCTLVNQTISNSLIQFYSNQYVSAFVTPSNVFKLQTKAFISQFKSTTATGFLLSLAMIRNTTHSNTLFSGRLTNYKLDVSAGAMHRSPCSYGNCTCTSSATCISQSSIYDSGSGYGILFTIPGLYTGCYIIESLLQSDLQCFYNQTCINKLQSYFQGSSLMNVTALDTSMSSQFLENSTIGDILDQLMVEEWINSSIYENYYNECKPSHCSYTVTTKNSAIYIITTLIGLVGGLITVLKLMVPYLVKFIMLCIKKCIHRSTTIMPMIQT
ncbi:unnamed protein product [Adineta steineri]|uniref:Uncharacterized protein n=1 Tax=Adineta steineri TaxID=433720 RepID=A0A814IK45_9BILA|nr:unnamed protein product [Adineta steineri]